MLCMLLPRASKAQARPSPPDKTMVAVSKAQQEGRLLDAEKILRDAIGETQKGDPNSPRLADYLKRLALLVGRKGDSAEADALMQRAFEVDRNALGPADLRVANDIASVAYGSLNRGRTQEAEQLFMQALEIAQLRSSHLETMSDINGAGAVFSAVASFYIKENRLAEAEAMLLQMKKVCDLLPPHPGIILGCDSAPTQLAQLYRSEGKVAEADQQPPVTSYLPPELAALNRLAEKYANDGLYPSAEDTYNRAIALAEKMDADPQSRYASLVVGEMNSLAQLFEKEGLKDRAERTYASALEMIEKLAGPQQPNHKLYATILNPHRLIDFYRREGRLKDAEPLLQRVLEIQEQSLGERDGAVAQTLLTLAGIYQEEGKNNEIKYAPALPLYERALAIQQVNLGPDHPELVGLLRQYADLLLKLHDDAKAAQVQARIDMISRAQRNQQK